VKIVSLTLALILKHTQEKVEGVSKSKALLNPSIEQLEATESHTDYSIAVTKCEWRRERGEKL